MFSNIFRNTLIVPVVSHSSMPEYHGETPEMQGSGGRDAHMLTVFQHEQLPLWSFLFGSVTLPFKLHRLHYIKKGYNFHNVTWIYCSHLSASICRWTLWFSCAVTIALILTLLAAHSSSSVFFFFFLFSSNQQSFIMCLVIKGCFQPFVLICCPSCSE